MKKRTRRLDPTNEFLQPTALGLILHARFMFAASHSSSQQSTSQHMLEENTRTFERSKTGHQTSSCPPPGQQSGKYGGQDAVRSQRVQHS
eukprot:5545623-Amphidinium_carterae.1